MSTRGAVVLCGGKSRRMGQPKAWLDFAGEPMLRHVLRTIAPAVQRLVVVAAPGQDLPQLPSLPIPVEITRDAIAGQGPLQGIATGLQTLAAHCDFAFVAATDAPFISAEFVRCVFRLTLAGAHDVGLPVVADDNGQLRRHPLAAVYRCSLFEQATSLLDSGKRRPFDLFESARTLQIEEADLLADPLLMACDPMLKAVSNLNTPNEYAAAVG